ncbi:MAG: hypothetical protein KAX13_12640, partial [Candidatus Krumholzibacteria bacterium]|nr:hypothetical protein [Candidatus Krumholzibacteria bacterium]
MMTADLIRIMREYRTFAPKSIRSALRLLADEFRGPLGTAAAALQLPREKIVYISNWPAGLGRSALEDALRIGKGDPYLWISQGGEYRADEGGNEAVSVLEIPVFDGETQTGLFVLIKMTQDGFGQEEQDSVPALSEFLSARLAAVLDSDTAGRDEVEDESGKIELLSSIGNDRRMNRVLNQLMEQAGCEFCAFHTGKDRERVYIMLEAAELSPHIEQIKRKLVTVYRMFSNREAGELPVDERIFFKNKRRNVAYLVGGSKLESYFLVPVMFASGLRGVLFFGSVRSEAFGKGQIELFRQMADGEERCEQTVYQPEGEMESLERLLGLLPLGGAIISQEG